MPQRAEVLRLRVEAETTQADRKLKKTGDQVEKTGKKAEKATGKMAKGFRDFQGSVTFATTAVLGAAGLAVAIRTIDQLAERADRITNVGKAFETLGRRIDANAATFLPKLRSATLGYVDDLTLMEKANNAIILGVAKTEDQFADLTRTAIKLGKAVGLDATLAIDSLVTGIGRQSRMMLDNLGIIVKVEEANRNYAASIGKVASELTEAERKQAFMTEALTKAKVAAEGLEPEVETLSDLWQQLKTDVTNTADAMIRLVNSIPQRLDREPSKYPGPRLFDPADLFRPEPEPTPIDMAEIERRRQARLVEQGRGIMALATPRLQEEILAAGQRGGAAILAARAADAAGHLETVREEAAEFQKIMADPKLKEDHFKAWREDMAKAREEAEAFARAIEPTTERTAALEGAPPGVPILVGDVLPPSLDPALDEERARMARESEQRLWDARFEAAQMGSFEQETMVLERLQERHAKELAALELHGVNTAALRRAQELEVSQIEAEFAEVRSQIAEQEAARKQAILKSTVLQAVNALGILFENNKIAAIANAIINTAEGVTKALSLGPWGIPLAAVIAAAGAKQIATIRSTSIGGGATISVPGGGSISVGALGGAGAGAGGGGDLRPLQITVIVQGGREGEVEAARRITEEVGRQLGRAGIAGPGQV